MDISERNKSLIWQFLYSKLYISMITIIKISCPLLFNLSYTNTFNRKKKHMV